MIAIDLTKQQELDADPKTIQQTNFTGNLDQNENSTMFFIIEKAEQIILDFSQGTVRLSCWVFNNLFCFNVISI